METVMTRYIHCIMLAVFVVSVVARLSCNNITLPSQGNCSCNVENEEAIVAECDGLKLTNKMGRSGENVEIICKNTSLSTSTLPTIHIEYVSYLTLVNCLTSGVTVSDIIDQLGVNKVRWLNVKGKMDALHKGQLANLPKVDVVVLDGLGLTQIDTSVFEDVNSSYSSFNVLSLMNNSITHLDVGAFSKLTELIRLDLSNNHLTSLPEDIFLQNRNLTAVALNDNQLENIDSLFGGKSNASDISIVELEINSNNIRELDERVFSKLRNLTFLSLSHNQLTNLPADLFINNKDLIELDLSHNKLENIDSLFGGKSNASYLLKIKSNNIRELDERVFSKIRNLQYLSLSHNKLTNLPVELFINNKDLIKLDLSHNKLENIDSFSIFGGKSNTSVISIKTLVINNNNIRELDKRVFSKLRNLTFLNLSHNQLTNLPAGLFINNKNLTQLVLSHNKLENIDSLFGGMSNASESSIELLEIKSNNIRELDERVFSKLRNLRYLSLSHNQLTNLPAELFINNKNLMKLDLSHNKMENIDRYLLKRLYKLEELDLSNNRLKHIKWDLWLPIEMRKLNISYNQLTTFNGKFDYIPIYTIEVLDLSNNYLNNLAPITSALKRINSLRLSNNSIQSLQLKDLAHIKTSLFLHLDDNNITSVNLNPYGAKSLNGSSPLVTVNLDNNPLNCDCQLHPFVRTTNNHEPIASTNNRIQFETNMNLICGSPPSLNHRSIMDLSLEDLSCPTVDGCPQPCTCYYRPEDSYIIVNCSGVGVPTSLDVRKDNNKTQLILSNNQLGQFTFTPNTWPDVTQLDLSHNRLTTFNIRNNTRSLKVLNLSYNLLTSITNDTVRHLQSLDSLSLHHNPWRCTCEDLELVNLVFNRKKIEKVDITKCEDGRLMMNLTESAICPKYFISS